MIQMKTADVLPKTVTKTAVEYLVSYWLSGLFIKQLAAGSYISTKVDIVIFSNIYHLSFTGHKRQ